MVAEANFHVSDVVTAEAALPEGDQQAEAGCLANLVIQSPGPST